MQYAMLLWPHANGRYEEAARDPAKAELERILKCVNADAEVKFTRFMNAGALTFEFGVLDKRQLSHISRHSLMFLFGMWEDNRAFVPLSGSPEVSLGEDLAFVQKYKGKTNERFIQQLINFALYSGDFSNSDDKISLLDPMCGRGTTLFQALNRGWIATGLDADRKEIQELNGFFEKYLQFHRVKHKKTVASRTIQGKSNVNLTQFAIDSEIILRTGCAEAAYARAAFGREAFHFIVADLPYGVQHSPSGKGGADSFENTLKSAMPAWTEALKTGGAIALSYNVFTLKTARVREIMRQNGLVPMEGAEFDRTQHWVEQAVTRDIAVGVKKHS